MFFIIGTKFFSWGSEKTPEMIRCSQCGALAQFTEKTGMRFISLFFIIPTIPISGKSKMIECPNCKARFQTE
ncbi:MAG: zinc ribbon domain-containing protein [Acidobacteriota bacterium]|nr:zinc ribbon domain-containing protein [Acidobacteriota bacterium]